jgi:hypothetical protein
VLRESRAEAEVEARQILVAAELADRLKNPDVRAERDVPHPSEVVLASQEFLDAALEREIRRADALAEATFDLHAYRVTVEEPRGGAHESAEARVGDEDSVHVGGCGDQLP